MFTLEWDKVGERFFESGVSQGVLYPMTSAGAYPKGVAWNGLTGVDENPDGAEEQILWADNIKYATFRTPENHKGSIKAYTYPDEWLPCDGQRSPGELAGLTFGQQKRQPFGFCYRTEIGNDTALEDDDGYILHLVYNSTVSPSSKSRATQNENPDAVEFSWDYSSTPVPVSNVEGVKQTATLELNSLKLGKAKMDAIEAVLYGNGEANARLPLPNEVITILNNATEGDDGEEHTNTDTTNTEPSNP